MLIDIAARERGPVRLVARFPERGVNTCQPVRNRNLAQACLHGLRLNQPEFKTATGDGSVSRMLDRTTGWNYDVPIHRTVRNNVDAEHEIFQPVTFHDHRAGTSTDVEQERGIDIRQVDEM